MNRLHIQPSHRGFTLIEVVIGITVFSLVMTAVFYFYSNSFNNSEKLKDKFNELRIAREFMDEATTGRGADLPLKGAREKENYRIEWRSFPVETGKEIVLTSGKAPIAQLHLVHFQLIKKQTGRTVLELSFLCNRMEFKTT